MNFLGSRYPIVAAPMAGGVSTPALALAVAQAGGFPFLAGGYKTLEALAGEVEQVRAATGLFGVNLFVPGSQNFDTGAFTRFARSLEADAAELGIALDLNPRTDDDGWEQKLAYLEDHPVPVVSFTFGLPEPQVLARLKAVGTATAVSVTLPEEALAAEANGADVGDARFTRTALTSAFTGRPARALVNRFMEHHDAEAIVAYPQVHFLTAALRQAAGKAGDAERLHLWAGTGWRSTQVESATVTVQRLAAGL